MKKKHIAQLLICAEVARVRGLIEFDAMGEIAEAVKAGATTIANMGDNDTLVIQRNEAKEQPDAGK